MLPAEVYSAGLRARGYAIANVFSMAVGFATQYSALPMYRSMHGWVWIFFACCMAFAFTIIFFFYPETKGVNQSLPLNNEASRKVNAMIRSPSKRSRSSSVAEPALSSSRPWGGGARASRTKASSRPRVRRRRERSTRSRGRRRRRGGLCICLRHLRTKYSVGYMR